VTTLDPLFRLLVRTLSEQHPTRAHQPIAINELMDSILPYRLVRRELGVDSSEDYETLLFRLCAGEGDFVQAEPATQSALEAELAKPLPDLALLRVYGDTHIVLRIDPMAAAIGLHPAERFAPPGEPMAQPGLIHGEPGAEAAAKTEDDAPRHGEEARENAAGWVPDPVFEMNATVPAATRERPDASTEPDLAPSQPRCPFCGGSLPPRMMINFCPHCGMGQDVGACRACGADMDVGWRYCVTCGEEAPGGTT